MKWIHEKRENRCFIENGRCRRMRLTISTNVGRKAMPEAGSGRGVITMAFGKQRYIEMAKWLGMSLRLNAPALASAIVTDSSDPILRDLFTYVIPFDDSMGKSVEAKFYLDRMSPFAETMFIDADCLVLNDLSALWELFGAHPVSAGGWRYLERGEQDEFVDVSFVLDHFQLDLLPKFNGGCYYFRRSPEASALFDTARELLAEAGSLRISCFREGGFPDEPLFALAFALRGLNLTNTGKCGMLTPVNSRGRIRLDVFAQKCSFRKLGILVHPDIVHFPGGFRDSYAYQREVLRLKHHFGLALPGIGERIGIYKRAAVFEVERIVFGLAGSVRDLVRPGERARSADKFAAAMGASAKP
jgi:hypothetical protein